MQLALYQTDTHIHTLDIVITYIATSQYMSLSLPILQCECSMVQLQQHCTHTLGFKTGIQNLCCTYTILYGLGDYCPCVSAPFHACTQWLHQRVQLGSSATNPRAHVQMHPPFASVGLLFIQVAQQACVKPTQSTCNLLHYLKQ